MEYRHTIEWYGRELGLSYLVAEKDNITKLAQEHGWGIEEALHAMLEGEYDRR